MHWGRGIVKLSAKAQGPPRPVKHLACTWYRCSINGSYYYYCLFLPINSPSPQTSFPLGFPYPSQGHSPNISPHFFIPNLLPTSDYLISPPPASLSPSPFCHVIPLHKNSGSLFVIIQIPLPGC